MSGGFDRALHTRILGCLILLLPARLFAQSRVDIKGFVKDLQEMFFIDNPDSIAAANIIHNRLNITWYADEHFSLNAQARTRVLAGQGLENIELSVQEDEFIELPRLSIDENAFKVRSVIDRLFLNYSSDEIQVRIGRQRVNWGVNVLWNPNDIFNTYNFLDFDYEERPGSDAIRAQYNAGTAWSLDAAYKPSRTKNKSIAGALLKTNKWGYDWQLLMGIYKEDLVIGGAWAGSISDAGFKGEFSYFRSKENFSSDRGLLSVALEGDYAFEDGWYVNGSFLFKSDTSPVSVITSNSTLSAKHLTPYKYTYGLNIAKQLNPLFSAKLWALYTPSNNSLILFPLLSWSAADNLGIDFIWQSFFSDMRGSFRTNWNVVTLRTKWSF